MTVTVWHQERRKPTIHQPNKHTETEWQSRAGSVTAQYENTWLFTEIILGNQEKVKKDNPAPLRIKSTCFPKANSSHQQPLLTSLLTTSWPLPSLQPSLTCPLPLAFACNALPATLCQASPSILQV